jgi:hypothetical protein
MEMYDVRNIRKAGAPYLCSSCFSQLSSQEKVDCVEIHRAAGAPEEWLQWWEGKLLRRGELGPGLPQHVWGEILARHYDGLLLKRAARADQVDP